MPTRASLLRLVALPLLLSAGAAPALAQGVATDLTTPPPNILLPNYNSVPIGPNAGLEGGAYVARVGDPSSAWINPAGLSRGDTAELSGAAGLYQLASVSPSALPDTGGSVQQLPSLVGVKVKIGSKWTAGIAVLTASSWSQSTDSQLVVSHPSGQERFAYYADSQYQQIAGTLSAGYDSGPWRFGGGVAIMHADLSRNEVVSDRYALATGLRTALVESRVSGTAIQLRPLFGLQYDASPHLLLGAMVRTPAVSITSSGSYTADGIAEGATGSQGVSFFDSGAKFDNRLPFELHGGVAYVSPRFEIEGDIHAYTPITTYAMLSSGSPIVSYGNPGGGAAPVITTTPFNGFMSQSRGIANVSVGGHFSLTENGVWRLHFGAETDASPVGPDDQVFTKVTLYGWTLGLSGTKGKFQFTAGLNYRSGTSDSINVRSLEDGSTVQSTIDIRTIGLIYALNYKF